MKEIECLPSIYLVPKKFHCSQQLKTKTTSSDDNDDVKFNFCNIQCSSLLNRIRKRKSSECNNHKKYLVVNDIENDMKISFNNQSDNNSKCANAEIITQCQLITSNKWESFFNQKQLNKNKWCEPNYYKCPTKPFNRQNKRININIYDLKLKNMLKNLINKCKKQNKFIEDKVIFNYRVIANTPKFITIESEIDFRVNKLLLSALGEEPETTNKWEDILKLIETQIGEPINNVFVQVLLGKN